MLVSALKSREQPESERKVKVTREMMTRRNDFVDCDRHKSRSAAVYEIGPTRTMPQIIIGLRIGERGRKGEWEVVSPCLIVRMTAY